MFTEQQIPAPCDCAAATEGKWAGIHHPSCASIQRRPICNGDGGESERLHGLSVGHVLTEDDIKDIRNLTRDYSDEIGQTADLFHHARQDAIQVVAPDKAELVNKIDDLQVSICMERALKMCAQKEAEDWKEKYEAVQADFERTIETPCPRCRETY